MLRSCSRCGRIHDTSYKCNRGSLPKTKEQELRNLNKWHKKSREIRERSLYLCAVCKDQHTIRYDDDLEVHHIIKLKDNPDGLLDDDNLICLCIFHHKQADSGDLDIDYLRSLVKQRDSNDYTLL